MKKIIIIIISAVVVIAAAVGITLGIVLGNKGGNQNNNLIDQARNIKIVQIEGKAKVTDSKETTDCFKGMNLYNGDTVDVEADSVLVLRFDEDKYVYIDQLSTIKIKSEGKDKTKTNIYVEKGKV